MGKQYTADAFVKNGATADDILVGDGSTTSKAALGGGGAGTRDFVASGAISAGQVVGLKSDGTVEIIENATVTEGFGTAVVFESGATNYISSVYDSTSNRVIVAYRDESNLNYGTAIVGTVSGTSISFGSEVVFNSGATDYISSVYDSTNNKVVIAYRDGGNSQYGTAIVGTVSGTSISFGTAVVFNSGTIDYNTSATYDSTNNKIVIAYTDAGNSYYGTAIVGTVSGTSISFGSEVVFESATTVDASATYDSTNNRVVIAYRDVGNSQYGTAIVGTVSGTSISFGTAVVFKSALTVNTSATYDSTNNRVVIAYRDWTNSKYGTAIVGTVSGTSISFGSEVVFNSGNSASISATYDSTNNRVVIAYNDGGNSYYGTAIVGTVSGTSISFGSEVVYNSNLSYESIGLVSNSTENKVIISYENTGDSDKGTAIVFTFGGTATNEASTIGIATEAIADTATGTVTIIAGVNDQQTLLTIGTLYYVQYDGTVTATPNASYGFKKLGRALSATEILIENIE